LVAGVAVGLLLATGKGSETFRKVKDVFKNDGDGAKEKAEILLIQGMIEC
jgi:hypothetical protein